MIQLNNFKENRQFTHLISQSDTPKFKYAVPFPFEITKINRGRASEHIGPFILDVYDIKESYVTQLITKCIIKLDNLAIQIDTLIDSTKIETHSIDSVVFFDRLDSKVINCFDELKDFAEYNKLVSSTLDCVKLSLKFNTKERHLVYNFRKSNQYSSSTMYYLYPLIKYLTSFSEISHDPKHVFLLITNYIQLLDDFVDIYSDIAYGINTPVTKKFIEIQKTFKPSPDIEIPFVQLIVDVKIKLDALLQSINLEIVKINRKQYGQEILKEWYKFHNYINLLPIPLNNNFIDECEYLKKIHNVTPPLLCYIPG